MDRVKAGLIEGEVRIPPKYREHGQDFGTTISFRCLEEE